MINREKYLSKLKKTKNLDLIKVITGIRRSGKTTLLLMYRDFLLNSGVCDENIIYINFESGSYNNLINSLDLYNYIKDKINNGKNYILLDEIQMVTNWQKAVNSIKVDFDTDIYITGSNAYLLSGELATLLSGRYIEIKMYPLSFKEFIDFNKGAFGNNDEIFEKYLKYGGLPSISSMYCEPEIINSYLTDIYNSVIKKDIIDRNNIKDVHLLEKIIIYLSSNIGSLVSPNSMSNYLSSNKIVSNCNHQTIDNYLIMLQNSFIIYKANRYDIRGKELLKTLGKYYISDLGIRNNLLGFKNIFEGHILENIVFLELLRRGYKVYVGKIGDCEVDFVAEDVNEVKYYQVTQSLNDENVFKREMRSLQMINDNYEKTIITMDRSINNNIDGIKIKNIIDFLLE